MQKAYAKLKRKQREKQEYLIASGNKATQG